MFWAVITNKSVWSKKPRKKPRPIISWKFTIFLQFICLLVFPIYPDKLQYSPFICHNLNHIPYRSRSSHLTARGTNATWTRQKSIFHRTTVIHRIASMEILIDAKWKPNNIHAITYSLHAVTPLNKYLCVPWTHCEQYFTDNHILAGVTCWETSSLEYSYYISDYPIYSFHLMRLGAVCVCVSSRSYILCHCVVGFIFICDSQYCADKSGGVYN